MDQGNLGGNRPRMRTVNFRSPRSLGRNRNLMTHVPLPATPTAIANGSVNDLASVIVTVRGNQKHFPPNLFGLASLLLLENLSKAPPHWSSRVGNPIQTSLLPR